MAIPRTASDVSLSRSCLIGRRCVSISSAGLDVALNAPVIFSLLVIKFFVAISGESYCGHLHPVAGTRFTST